jgi:hypothetical protein
MLDGIKRYNRGFVKFGPLEQAADGELVFVKDLQAEFDEREEEFTTVLKERDMWVKSADDWREDCFSNSIDLIASEVRCLLFIAGTIVFAAISIAEAIAIKFYL